jgi:serine/threonine-protein kinase
MALEPGTRLGPYEIRSLIGAGGMGEVYRAHDRRLGRDVAVKVLSEQWAGDADARARFEREARAVAALSHPNIVGIHDIGSDQGRAWAVTELLEGETLADLLGRRRLELEEVHDLARQMTAGVAAAHAGGVTHRDLKPANLFVTEGDVKAGSRLKILDFGLAKGTGLTKDSGDDATLGAPTRAGMVLGTVGYMSPEQAQGLATDRSTDVFALGAILYEMLTGRRAFSGPSQVAILSAILRDEPDLSSLPPAWKPIVARCLAKRSADRFASAAELASALSSVQATAGSRAVAAVADAERSIAVLPLTNVGADPETEYFSDGVTEEIINALSQVPRLRVAARTSSFYFKGHKESLRSIAQTLGVQALLEGSVRRAGKRVRITIQLVNADDGYQMWSERYDRDLDDVFAVQDEIAASVASRLRVTLSGKEEGERAAAPASASPSRSSAVSGASAVTPTPDPEAYDLYLRGRYLSEQRHLRGSISCFEEAIARDPDFALAHVGLAESMVFMGFMAHASPREAMPRAKAAAERALALDAGLARAYYALAMVAYLYEWNKLESERLFLRGLELEPSQPDLHMGYGLMLAETMGRFDEALEHARTARAVDPVNPMRLAYLGMILYSAGRAQEAMRLLAEAARREPNHFILQRVYGIVCHACGRLDDAAAAVECALAASNRHIWCLGDLALLRLDQGRDAEAEAVWQEMLEQARERGSPSCFPTLLWLRRGDVEAAAASLEEAVRCRESTLTLTYWPQFEPLQREPRLRAILEREGLGGWRPIAAPG